MKIVFLDADTLKGSDLSAIAALGDLMTYEKSTVSELLPRCKDADVIITNKVVIDKASMQALPSLKLIVIAATGMNNVDLDAAEALGIAVKNAKGYSTDSVIQHTFSMLFYLLGASPYYDRFVNAGEYSSSALFTHLGRPFHEIKGKKWGIIGLGTIGKGVAHVAEAFGAHVCYYSTSGQNQCDDFKEVTLSTLLETSDIISIHAPLNEQTKYLLSQSELLQLKEGACVLNLGRGGIIDEAALVRIFDAKTLYVGLDVFEHEPLSADDPLVALASHERVYLTPHIAWTSVEARDTLVQIMAQNIQTVLPQ